MQWQTFEQATVPQNEVFILALGEDIFFAKVYGERIITKGNYNDCRDVPLHGVRCRGGEISWFLHNLDMQGIKPLWAHFHKPETTK